MTQLTSPAGLGADSYLRYQKEIDYGTAVTSSMTDLPTKPGTILKSYGEPIENDDLINDRMAQEPDEGRKKRTLTLMCQGWPTRLGDLLNLHFGAAAGSTDNLDGSYENYWLTPTTGVNTGVSWTIQQAIAGMLADQVDGIKSDNLTITQDTSNNMQIASDLVGQGETLGVARASSFSYPARSTNPPFKFGHAKIVLTDTGGSDTILICANSLEIAFPMNHDIERYKICAAASSEISEPVFNGRPGATITMNIDADRYALDRARSYSNLSMVITWTHSTSQAGSTPTYHTLEVEYPRVRFAPDAEIPTTTDRVQMDVTFNVYASTSTNSGSTNVMYEVRYTDSNDFA